MLECFICSTAQFHSLFFFLAAKACYGSETVETDYGAEVARHFDPDVSANAVSLQFGRYFNKEGQRVRDHVAAGGNPMSLKVLGAPR